MAKRRKKRTAQRRKKQEYPGWVWMIFGLALGLSVAFAMYVRDRDALVTPATATAATSAPTPTSLQSTIDRNGETPDATAEQEPVEKPRFDFYEMLPLSSVEIEQEVVASRGSATPVAVEKPGVYKLQAGSFSTHADAEKRRAELGLIGIQSMVVPANVNGRTYHRVFIGPIDDLDELNLMRSRLRAAKIDVWRIRLVD